MLHLRDDSQNGFTLIELLVTMAISMVVVGALANTFVTQRKTYDVQRELTEAIQMTRAVMDMMTREIRMAGYDPTGSGFAGIPYDSTQLQIFADLDSNGTLTDSNENVTYKFYPDTDEIKRRTGAGNFQPFAENAEAFSFEYLDGDGNATITSDNIRQIKITITVRTEHVNPTDNQYRNMILTSYVTPRNLAYD